MPIIRVNQQDEGIRLHKNPAPALAALGQAARVGDGPVIVMVHGFKFRPETPGDCPHDHIFAMEDQSCWKALSWPRALGFGTGAPDEGLALAFGWEAKGMIWSAYARAALAGRMLARAVRTIRAVAPHREVHAIAHSLGARVVLQALPHLSAGDIGRIIALNPAEFSATAEAALASAAGQSAELIAVTGRENAGYDLMLERLVAAERPGDRAIGRGRAPDLKPGRMVLRIDRPSVARHLASLGFPLAPRRRVMCHWSPYLRGGTMALYAALMRKSRNLPLDALHVPASSQAARDPAPMPLPWGWKAPS